MSLLHVLPESAAADLGHEPTLRRRTPHWVWGVCGTVVLGLVWWFLPMLGLVADPVRPQIPPEAGLPVDTYGADGATFLHYRHGETVTVTVPIQNRSPLPLTVSTIAPRTESRPLLTLTAATDLPLRLGPFEQQDVELTYEFGNCRYWHERGAQTVDTVSLSGATVGRAWSQQLRLEEPLIVHSQVINNCPDRTLVRGDDTR